MAANIIGRNVRAQRKILGLSQQAVADAAGVERAHLTRIEGGRWVPRLDTLARIAKALDSSVGELLSPAKSNPQKRTA